MNRAVSGSYLQVALPVPLVGFFDYHRPSDMDGLEVGSRVVVPFGHRELTGVVTGSSNHSSVDADKIQQVIEWPDDGQAVLNEEQLQLLEWCARYYRHAPGEVFINALPPALRKRSGRIPAPPVQFRITAAGIDQLEAGPGRARVRFELMQKLASGPGTLEQLKQWRKDVNTFVRPLLEDGLLIAESADPVIGSAVAGPTLTAEQEKAVAEIESSMGGFRAHLLDGVTGSGKTEVYLRLIEQRLGVGQQVLVLVPEIGLTPQLVRRFEKRLGLTPAVYHSACSNTERLRTWADAREGRARLIIGTRSSLFLPLPKAGLIIMDESHDASFKQQEGFRFAARDVAVKRAAGLKVPIVMGTATPSMETVLNAQQGRYGWSRLRERATGAKTPAWRMIDLKQERATSGLTAAALEHMDASLSSGGQVLVFLNRRGYAPVLLCHECGWHASCPDCDANMTWHRSADILICHHCEHRHRVPVLCPDCAADALHGAGEGTQQIEGELGRRFPDTPLYRFDADQFSRKGSFENMTERVREGDPCILVGTQMLAKGHHFPNVTLVVVVSLDQALYSPDFRALERMGQLLVQVAGRAGREERPGTVLLQTHHPDHPLLEMLINDGYTRFAEAVLVDRQVSGMPPYSYQATIRAQDRDRDTVLRFLNRAAATLKGERAAVHGPFAALMERKGGNVRWYILIQASSRPDLQAALAAGLPGVRALKEAARVRWMVDVDPQEF